MVRFILNTDQRHAPCQWLRHSTFLLPVLLALGFALTGSSGQGSEKRRAAKLPVTEPIPLAAWSFAQADGDFVPDATGHGYDAHIHGQARLVPSWGGRTALEFDGSGDNSFWQGQTQNCGLSIEKHLDRAFTELSVEAWVRKSRAGWMPVIYRDLWDTPSGFGLYMEWSEGKAVFGHYDKGGHKSTVQSITTVQDGRWHHLVGTMQPLPKGGFRYRIYVDGHLDGSQTGSWAVTNTPPEGGILKIAYPNSSGADHPYRGSLGDIALFDVALTPAQIKARFKAGRAH